MKNHTTYSALRAELDAMTADQLRRELFNRIYNRWISRHADDEHHAVDGGKSIPYIGWFWRSCDFYNKRISIGYCGFVGVMENNKWDCPERELTTQEADTFISYIDRAMSADDGGGVVSEMEHRTWQALRELWNWMQTLRIHDGPASTALEEK